MATTAVNAVLRVAAASCEQAITHFEKRLSVEADVSDVHAAMESGDPGFVLLDSRSRAAWEQGHLPGAVHVPTAEIPERAAATIPPGTLVVAYCWGPGCNGATRASLALARLGYPVKEMIGGYEYWVREGFAVQSSDGRTRGIPDPLTVPLQLTRCGC